MATTTTKSKAAMIVVDLKESQSRHDIDKLANGDGPLMEDIEELLDDLVEEKTISESAQPVVVVVKEKSFF